MGANVQHSASSLQSDVSWAGMKFFSSWRKPVSISPTEGMYWKAQVQVGKYETEGI